MKIQPNQIQQPAEKQQADRDPKVLEAAKMYEQLFLGEMVKAMRQSVQKSDLVKENMAEKIFTDQLYDKYVDEWSDAGGVGLSDIIYDQIMEKYGALIEGKKQMHAPIKPGVNQKMQMQQIKNPQGALLYKLNKPADEKEVLPVVTPWGGKITGVNKINGSNSAVFIDHDNGLKSTLVFEGTPLGFTENQTLSPGQKIGSLPPSVQSILWKIEKV